MNIQQYYRLAANISLNGSLLALALAALLLLPLAFLLPGREFILFIFPLLFYSFLSFQKYLIHKYRSEEIAKTCMAGEAKHGLLREEAMVLQYMPAPSLRLLIFHPGGRLLGEIRDLEHRKIRWFLPYFIDRRLPPVYGLFNEDNQLIAAFRWRKCRLVEISSSFSSGYGFIEREGKADGKKRWLFLYGNRSYQIESESFFTDIKFKTGDISNTARLRKGWMPLEWEPYIKNANAPVMSFSKKAKTEDRLTVFAVMTLLLRYHDH